MTLNLSKRTFLNVGWGLFAVACLGWGFAVVQHEGLQWPAARLASMQPFLLPAAVLHVLVFLGGMMAGLGLARKPASLVWTLATLCWFLLVLGVLNTMPWFAVLKVMPEWYSIFGCGTLVCALALGYGVRNRALPLWPILFLPAAAAVYCALASGNCGFLFGVLFLALFACGLGTFLGDRFVSGAQLSFAVSGALGLSVLILLVRLLGAAGGAGKSVVLGLLIVLTVVARQAMLAQLRSLRSWVAAERSFSLLEWSLVGFGVGFAFAYWVGALGPELGPDALGGRSSLPATWARVGTITAVPEIFTSYMGIGGEILNLVFYPFAGDTMAKASTLVSAIFLTGAFLESSNRAERPFRFTIGTLFFSSTVIAWQFVHGFVDLHVALMVVVSVALFESWTSSQRLGWLWISGIIAGTAIGIKLNAASIVPVTGLLLLYLGWKKGRLWLPFFAYAAGVAISCVPALARTWILTGNPVFPFANTLFKSPLAEQKLQANLYGTAVNWSSFLLPFRMVVEPAKFNELGTYHPLFWCVALVALLWIWWAKETRILWAFSALVWLGWLLTEQNTRYSIPAFALTAYALCRSQTPLGLLAQWRGWALFVLSLSGCALNFARPTAWMWADNRSGTGFPILYALGEQSDEEYRQIFVPSSILAKRVNDSYGEKAVVWETPFVRDHLYFKCRTIAHPHGTLPVVRPLEDLLPGHKYASDYSKAYSVIKGAGITHLVWETNNPWVRGLPESEWPGIFAPGFSQQNLYLVAASRNLRLYRLRGEEPAPPAPVLRALVGSGQVNVVPGSLVGLQMEWSRPIPSGSFVDMVWLSRSGKLVFFERVAASFAAKTGWHRHWQTAPPGAEILKVNLSPGSDLLTLNLLRIPDEK